MAAQETVATLREPANPEALLPPITTSTQERTGEPLEKNGIAPEPVEVAAVALAGALTVEALRLAVISALADSGHTSAAQLLGGGSWTIDGSNLRIEVAGMGKKMLALTVNAAAEKIIRQETQRLGGPARFLVVPGEGIASGASVTSVPVAGSIQETALTHPLVQRAKEIFKAEVRSVVDLRTR
jgi:DNA polymerase-3 subunit gamma/tau